MSLIDTAEMYGGGATEELVGEALAGRREEAFLVSKVMPHHAGRDDLRRACERSLRRLGTTQLDLYLLHWRGSVPLQASVEGFEGLREAGLIRHWGVSNFDLPDMLELLEVPHARAVQADQVLYNLLHRGIEWNLLPWCREERVPLMAYSPIEGGRLVGHPALRAIAARHRATSAQVALAWVLAKPGVCVLSEAGSPEHVGENRAAVDLQLREDDVRELDSAFPPPSVPQPLAVR
jgi:diketogulonate reductase-like aldo/keto reductase